MGQTLGIANERGAYTITDRATFLAFQKRITLPILVEKDRPLLNIYSVMEVNPANGPRVNPAGGKAFADFMLTPETQAVIKTFGVDKYGQPLFVPIGGTKSEEEVGG
jgi:tungstate transport system substrate-binding protein